MRKEEAESFRKLLEDRLVSLYRAHQEVRSSATREDFAQNEPHDEADEAQRTEWRSLRMHLAEHEAGLAQRIEEALHRLTRGEYGECLDCGGEIERSRLRVIPWTTRCVDCQEAHEFTGRDRSPSL